MDCKGRGRGSEVKRESVDSYKKRDPTLSQAFRLMSKKALRVDSWCMARLVMVHDKSSKEKSAINNYLTKQSNNGITLGDASLVNYGVL